MTATWRAAADGLAADLRGVFADRLRAVVAYGPHLEGRADAPVTCLALVASLTIADLEACARYSPRWSRSGVATPLLLPEDEFRRSLDAFPLEYAEIVRAHARIFGDDPFEGIAIADGDLRRACETQVKSHLLHLREGFIEAAGRPAEIASLVRASAPAFAALLRNVARLNGVNITDRMAATREGARAVGLPDRIVEQMLALDQSDQLAATDAARLFPDYLAAVEQLARAVDTWRG
ncbi:MAG TPA: hypothetical protein VNM91_00170 [Dehalococcoidia bacterium]|nr:hypothetical protein [Dehalococcoidia bacterium]